MTLQEKEIFNPIVTRILSLDPGVTPKNPQYAAFYREIVTRCVADVAGMLQTTDETKGTKPGAELATIYDRLAKRFEEENRRRNPSGNPEYARKEAEGEARAMIIENLHGFVKGQVHTPHPTEVFSNEAIEAEERLVAALLNVPGIFKISNGMKTFPQLEEKVETPIMGALKDLAVQIQKPLSQGMEIDDEMLRSIRFSQRQFDSIPEIANTILHATNTKSRDFKEFRELEKFSSLIEPHTWSPGDQDSKPDMTAEMLIRGMNMNHRAMMFHYYRELAALADTADSNGDLGNGQQKELTERLMQRMLYKLLKAGNGASGGQITGQFAEERLKGLSVKSEAKTDVEDTFSKRYSNYASRNFFKDFKNHIGSFADETGYADTQDFLHDLQVLRNRPGMLDIRKEKHDNLSSIDTLVIQAMNFKQAALRVQIRQNADMHSEVLETLLGLDPVKQALAPGQAESLNQHHREKPDAAPISALLDRFHKDAAFSDAVKGAVEAKLKSVSGQIEGVRHEIEAARAPGKIDKKKEKEKFNEIIHARGLENDYHFYQTLESMGQAAQHPDRIPKYLIAECSSTSDMLEAFFLLKVMESLRAPDQKKKVEVVNLVEYPNLVTEREDGTIAAVEMTRGAMSNPYFRDHHLSITTSNHLLEDYSRDGGKKDLTVADVKNAYGYALKKGDETRKIEGVKMMMGAGSDVTKAGSVAAAALMMEAMSKTREALLNLDHPVLLQDYIGCGGGVHRTQPVSTSFETVQGRSMRQSAENIAQKIIGLLTTHLFHKLAMNPLDRQKSRDMKDVFLNRFLGKERQHLVRVNLGNMAGLTPNQDIWENYTKPRTVAMVKAWGDFYDSPEFNSLVINRSAKPFVDLTQYAARPPKREGTVATVKSLRAIGFGASLNAAGICAPMFFGGSAYLAGDKALSERENAANLKQMYLYDPKAQDTINRMTYGVIMSDMDVAWKYAGHKSKPDISELQALAAKHPANEQERAEKALAMIHLEYDKVASQLLDLHRSILNVRDKNKEVDGKAASEELLAILPRALKEQLTLSRANIRQPREELANLFTNIDKDGQGVIDTKQFKRESQDYSDRIYPAMGAIYECFEHTPRAYTRPKWVRATEQQHGIAA